MGNKPPPAAAKAWASNLSELQEHVQDANACAADFDGRLSFEVRCTVAEHRLEGNLLWRVFSDVFLTQMEDDGGMLQKSTTTKLTLRQFYELKARLEVYQGHGERGSVMKVPSKEEQHEWLAELHSTTSNLSASSTENECCVCMDAAPDVSLPCSHSFCAACVADWNARNAGMSGTCPVCRESSGGDGEEWELTEAPSLDECAEDIRTVVDGAFAKHRH